MEDVLFNVINEKEGFFEFELPGKDHGFCNLLVSYLWKEKGVVAAAYNISHHLIGKPVVVLQYDKKLNPKDIIKSALSKILDDNNKLKAQVIKNN